MLDFFLAFPLLSPAQSYPLHWTSLQHTQSAGNAITRNGGTAAYESPATAITANRLSADKEGNLWYELESENGSSPYKGFGLVDAASEHRAWSTLAYGFILGQGELKLVKGEEVLLLTSYQSGDRLELQKEGIRIHYLRNQQVMHTATISQPTDFAIGVCIVALNDGFQQINSSFNTLEVSARVQKAYSGSDIKGAIFLETAGGTPPYSYQWQHGPSGAMLTDLAPGSYTVTVSDSKDLQATETITVGSHSILQEHNNRNWQHSLSFDPEGRITGEAIQYVDPIGRPLQTQQRLRSKDLVLTVQPVYDAYGRAVLQSLPAPIGTEMGYKEDFITNASGTVYSAADFDRALNGSTLTDNTNSPQPVGQSIPNSLGHYYSNAGSEAQVPTTDYPYTRTASNGGLSRVSAPGDAYKMGSGHESRSYTLPSANELRPVFGAGTKPYSYKVVMDAQNPMQSSSYEADQDIQAVKSIQMDAEGNTTISFTAEGLLLATCRSGVAATSCNSQSVSQHMHPDLKTIDIHLPESKKSTLQLPVHATKASMLAAGQLALHYQLFDLATMQPLSAGTDYTISYVPGVDPHYQVQFLYNAYSGFFRIRYSYDYLGNDPLSQTAQESLEAQELRYELDYSHWTLNYYDAAGRLRKEVQPKGVVCDYSGNHSLYSSFDYDAHGRLIAREEPDAGKTEYRYDDEGKLRFSRNSLQAANNQFSYVNYDALGRMVESGQYSTGSNDFQFQNHYGQPALSSGNSSLDNIKNDLDGLGTNRSEQHYQAYGLLESNQWVPGTYSHASHYPQMAFAAGRLSKSWNAETQTWYTYDWAGRPLQSLHYLNDNSFSTVTDQRIKSTDYHYNSGGQLHTLAWQEHDANEAFSHHYRYNADGALEEVRTTTYQGRDEQLHARYHYYSTGALKRVELGDYLQGMD